MEADAGGEMGMVAVTVTVTNVDEAGTVSLSEEARVGVAVIASVTDPDGGVTDESWQWARSSDGSTGWVDIAGATSASYTPVGGDQNMYLRVTASYTDGEGSGKTEMATAANAVIAADTRDRLLVEYDPNADGEIEKADMRRAVADYFGQQPTLIKADMRRLVAIYFS